MSTPAHQLKAEFFKTLAHPVRVKVLELLCEREHAVAEMLPEVGVEASNLSQQLAVLRGAGLVTARREGSAVYYTLTDPRVADLLAVARSIRTSLLTDQLELLSDAGQRAGQRAGQTARPQAARPQAGAGAEPRATNGGAR